MEEMKAVAWFAMTYNATPIGIKGSNYHFWDCMGGEFKVPIKAIWDHYLIERDNNGRFQRQIYGRNNDEDAGASTEARQTEKRDDSGVLSVASEKAHRQRWSNDR